MTQSYGPPLPRPTPKPLFDGIPDPPPPSQQVGERFPGPESFEDFKMFAIAFIGGLLGAVVGVLIGWSLS